MKEIIEMFYEPNEFEHEHAASDLELAKMYMQNEFLKNSAKIIS